MVRLLFLGDLPNPLHGMSKVNLQVSELEAIPFSFIINTAPSYASRTFGSPFWGAIKFVHFLLCSLKIVYVVVRCRNQKLIVYRPINGGFGQVYDIAYTLILRLALSQFVIHHHSFAYLNKQTFTFKWLLNTLPTDAIHLTLGQEMKDALVTSYRLEENSVRVVSNLAFFEQARLVVEKAIRPSAGRVIVIGHLANLCVAKGLQHFADLCNTLASKGVIFEARIAGPTADDEAAAVLAKLVTECPQVDYVGPIYGDQKNDFYRSLDVFVFFSEYENEAAPLVLYEAAQAGVYLIGSQRGCMKSIIEQFKGTAVTSPDKFVSEALKSILLLYEADLQNVNRTQVALFQREYTAQAATSLGELYKALGVDSHV